MTITSRITKEEAETPRQDRGVAFYPVSWFYARGTQYPPIRRSGGNISEGIMNAPANKYPRLQLRVGAIRTLYSFSQTVFWMGDHYNKAGENEASLLIFAFAQKHRLAEDRVLDLFAEAAEEVKASPEGVDHPNIRQFLKRGLDGFVVWHNPQLRLRSRPETDETSPQSFEKAREVITAFLGYPPTF